jgi:hypothetical protein
MKKINLSFYFIFIAFFSFITIFSVIVQKSYNNLMTPIKLVESNILLTPINPELNIDIIKEIESRPENIDISGVNLINDSQISTSSATN